MQRLKRALFSYFFFEQSIHFPINPYTSGQQNERENVYDDLLDKRYDNLIAGISYLQDKEIRMLDNVRIITWNYDVQIELAIKNFVNRSILETKQKFNIHPNKLSYNSTGADSLKSNQFCVMKLNGSAFLDNYFDDSFQVGTLFDNQESTINSQEDIVFRYCHIYSNVLTNPDTMSDAFKNFNFAWEEIERYNGYQNFYNHVLQEVRKTAVLIVVGYSFPFFNAKIDSDILTKLSPQEIIIQDINPQLIQDRIIQLVPSFAFKNSEVKFIPLKESNYFPMHRYLIS